MYVEYRKNRVINLERCTHYGIDSDNQLLFLTGNGNSVTLRHLTLEQANECLDFIREGLIAREPFISLLEIITPTEEQNEETL